MHLELLTRPTGWYGRYSGYYEQLPAHLQASGLELRVLAPRNSLWCRAAGKLIASRRRLPARDQSITWSEFVFARRLRPADRCGHVLAFEAHLPFFARGGAELNRVCTTLHLPPDLLGGTSREVLTRVRAGIVLYQRDLEFFESRIGRGRVRFVRHGVDTEFFHPAPTPPPNASPRLAYVGQFGRDTAQAARVLPRLLALRPDTRIDMVLAKPAFRDAELGSIAAHPAISWHFGISDTALRSIYHSAQALFLPMSASGANNAIVEALACGLPIVTTDVGGIRDYGGGTLYPLAAAGDDDGLIELAEHWLDDAADRQRTSRQLRHFAQTELQWSDCARAHANAYRDFFA